MHHHRSRIVPLALAGLAMMAFSLGQVPAQNPNRSADDQGKRLTLVVRGTRYGFIDETGRVVIPFMYQNAGEDSEGLIRVQRAGKWGFINEEDRIVIPIQFDCADDFSEGLARVVVKRKYGYVDRTGRMAIPAKFDLTGDSDFSYFVPRFSEGLAPFAAGDKFGYIDKTGAVVIAPEFTSGDLFSDGLALVNAGSNEKPRYGYVNKSGKVAIAPQFSYAESFREGLALVVVRGGRFGYIDKTGAMVIAPQFDGARSFSEGFAAVSYGDFVILLMKHSGQYSPCLSKAELSAAPRGMPGGVLAEEPRAILHGDAAFIGKDGQPVREPAELDIGQFSEGLAPVHLKEGWGYMDTSGTTVIGARFSLASCFRNGLAEVEIQNKHFLIDHKGKIVWRLGY
jgi:hypothetical protein